MLRIQIDNSHARTHVRKDKQTDGCRIPKGDKIKIKIILKIKIKIKFRSLNSLKWATILRFHRVTFISSIKRERERETPLPNSQSVTMHLPRNVSFTMPPRLSFGTREAHFIVLHSRYRREWKDVEPGTRSLSSEGCRDPNFRSARRKRKQKEKKKGQEKKKDKKKERWENRSRRRLISLSRDTFTPSGNHPVPSPAWQPLNRYDRRTHAHTQPRARTLVYLLSQLKKKEEKKNEKSELSSTNKMNFESTQPVDPSTKIINSDDTISYEKICLYEGEKMLVIYLFIYLFFISSLFFSIYTLRPETGG